MVDRNHFTHSGSDDFNSKLEEGGSVLLVSINRDGEKFTPGQNVYGKALQNDSIKEYTRICSLENLRAPGASA
uniref:Uncharacterized protein n=1 Tax=viral metagenome TaxID=1070528 RepID=A0A6C0BZY0_9ZZZZ